MPALALKQLGLAEYKVHQWVAAPQAGETLEDMLAPAYWVHVASKMSPMDSILVFPEDGTWEAELRVLAIGYQAAQVGLIRKTVWGTVEQPAAAEGQFHVEWAGPAHRWRIRRLSDNAVVAKDFDNREAAFAMLPELLKKAA